MTVKMNISRFFHLGILGLNLRFYIRCLIHASVFVFMIWMFLDYMDQRLIEQGKPALDTTRMVTMKATAILNALLYPYARYLYAKVWQLLFSEETRWYVGGILLLIVYYFKLVARVLLFSFAMFIAPVAWIVLYFDNSR